MGRKWEYCSALMKVVFSEQYGSILYIGTGNLEINDYRGEFWTSDYTGKTLKSMTSRAELMMFQNQELDSKLKVLVTWMTSTFWSLLKMTTNWNLNAVKVQPVSG